MATAAQKEKAVVAAAKRLAVVEKRRDKAVARLQAADDLKAAADAAEAAYQTALAELEWAKARPVTGEDEPGLTAEGATDEPDAEDPAA